MSDLGDLYEVLGLQPDCTSDAIGKAYRKVALKYHPDRNPDPAAADMFLKLSKAYEILSDEKAKAAYDDVMRARIFRMKKDKELDDKKRKMKQDLEAREGAFKHQKDDEERAKKDLAKEIERLRHEGYKKRQEREELLKEEMNRLRGMGGLSSSNRDSPVQFAPSGASGASGASTATAIKMKWNVKKLSPDFLSTINKENIMKAMLPFGPVDEILISEAKGTAIVNFRSAAAAKLASDFNWKSSIYNHFKVSLASSSLSSVPSQVEDEGSIPSPVRMASPVLAPSSFPSSFPSSSKPLFSSFPSSGTVTPPSVSSASAGSGPGRPPMFASFAAAMSGLAAQSASPAKSEPLGPNATRSPQLFDLKDYESVTMMRMRQAAERQKIAKQMMEEEEAAAASPGGSKQQQSIQKEIHQTQQLDEEERLRDKRRRLMEKIKEGEGKEDVIVLGP